MNAGSRNPRDSLTRVEAELEVILVHFLSDRWQESYY